MNANQVGQINRRLDEIGMPRVSEHPWWNGRTELFLLKRAVLHSVDSVDAKGRGRLVSRLIPVPADGKQGELPLQE